MASIIALVELAMTRETMLGSTPNCGQEVKWRATADEDGHYCFAVAL
jgi:hypothetical protein